MEKRLHSRIAPGLLSTSRTRRFYPSCGGYSLNIFLSLFLLFTTTVISAQSNKVEGTVTDAKGIPLIGASVIVKGTSKGATTDSKGKYSLNVEPGMVLTFSFSGYHPSEEKVDTRKV